MINTCRVLGETIKPGLMSEVEPEALYSRRLMGDQQDIKESPPKVLRGAFRCRDGDRKGEKPHGVSCYSLGDKTEQDAEAEYRNLPVEVTSGTLGICFFSASAVASASMESPDHPIELIPDEDPSDELHGRYHHVLSSPSTDCDCPEGDQACPTRDQAKKLALEATLRVPFTPKKNPMEFA